MENGYCLFCDWHNSEKHKILLENDFCYARPDNFPVSQGHIEIVPKSHITSFFELEAEQLTKLFLLLKEAQTLIQVKHKPDGYTIGINEGEAAGRTIDHLHIHIIPRYTGDVENPRGGIRNVIPGKGAY